ncbi:MAG TPA: DUF4214 domain-containing protein [Iamia sp.]|nr:DUF4214 domain-containing protein [Iamia sp.]
MPQTRSTATRLVALVVAVAIGITGFVAGPGTGGPAGAAVPTETPTIIGPHATTEGANPVLRWEPLDGVTRYRVQISTSDSFSPLIWNVEVANVTATPPTELPLGTVHWRVAGVDPSGSGVGPFAPASFTRARLDGPQLLSPTDGATLEYPSEPAVLRWEPVPGVKNYKVEVDDAPDFIGAQTVTTDATSWALTSTQPLGQSFYWRVQGQTAASGVNTEYSATWRYTLAWAADGSPIVPTLTEPAQGEHVTDVVFRWDPVAGAAKYQIQVSPNGDWANNITFDKVVMGTSYSPPVTLNNAPYFWRVRALSVRNPSDNGPWSPDGRQFTRSWADIPTLVAPADNDLVAQDFVLKWDPVPHAGAYEVQVGTDPNFTNTNSYSTCVTNHTDWTPYLRLRNSDPAFPARPGACPLADTSGGRLTYLRQGVRYYWRVRGLDISSPNLTPSALGRFSTVSSFMYLPGVGAPDPIGPTGTVSVPKLEWEPVPGVERYEIWVSVDGREQVATQVYGTSYVAPLFTPVDESATVTWRVRALQLGAPGGSSNGGAGPTVVGTTFTLTPSEPDAGSTPELVSPADGVTTVQPEFDWTPVAGATQYRVRTYPAGAPIPVATELFDPRQGSNSPRRFPSRSGFSPTTPITPGAYDWQVVAYDEDGNVLGASALRRITIAPLDVVTPTAPVDCDEGSACTTHQATPLMEWEPVEWAGFYRVHIALDPDFTNLKWVYTTTQTALRPMEALPDNQAGQSYHWFVQPCRSEDVCGRYDSGVFPTAAAFRKSSRPITLTSPADGSTRPDLVTFHWEAPSDQWVSTDANDDIEARHYRIQVATDAGFSEATRIDEALVDQTTYTPHDRTYPEGPLYWRVQAVDGSGNNLTYSPTWTVTKRSPLIKVTSPTSGAEVDGVPVIRWEPQPFAAKYEIEYYKNGDTSWTPSNRVGVALQTNVAAHTVLKTFAPGTYAYRVRRIDVDARGRYGPWSSDPPTPDGSPSTGDRRTFVVAGRAPSLVAPADGATFSRPRIALEWAVVPGAAAYRVETSSTAGFGSVVESQVTVMTSWSLLKPYQNGTFHWRVSALDAQGAVLGTSSARTFVHDLRRPTATITGVVAGPAAATVRWTSTANPVVGPITSFVVTPYDGAVAGVPVTVPGTATEATVTGLVNERSYRFTVTPYDANGIGTTTPQSGAVKPRAVAPFSSVERFIDRQFRDFFGRPPTTAEMNTYRSRLQGGASAASVIETLWNDKAHAGVMPEITRLYSAFFVRIPDYGGLDFWAQERRRGRSLRAAAEYFAKSAEFKKLYGTMTDSAYVDRVYLNVLGRTASAKDRAFWVGELRSGRRTRGTLVIGFSEAAEYKTKFQHDINATLVIMEMLRRTPKKPERDALSAALKGGQSLRATFTAMLSSTEYAARAT